MHTLTHLAPKSPHTKYVVCMHGCVRLYVMTVFFFYEEDDISKISIFCCVLVSENKVLCHPASVDSLSTSAGTEDHVSMGGYAARKALIVVEHVEQGKYGHIYRTSNRMCYNTVLNIYFNIYSTRYRLKGMKFV